MVEVIVLYRNVLRKKKDLFLRSSGLIPRLGGGVVVVVVVVEGSRGIGQDD